MSIEEIIKMAHNYGCLYEGTLNEEYSEETLLKDLKKKLTLTDVSQQRELLIAYEIESKKPYKMSREIAEAKVTMIMKAINCG